MYSFTTNLYIAECRGRIDQILEKNRCSYYEGKIKGTVDFKNDKFFLYKDKELMRKFGTMYRYGIQLSTPGFYGKMIQKEGGTIIQGDFHVHLSNIMIIILAFFFGPPAISAVFLFWSNLLKIIRGKGGLSLSLDTLAIAGVALIVIIILKLSNKLKNDKKEYILDFIKTELEAEETVNGTMVL